MSKRGKWSGALAACLLVLLGPGLIPASPARRVQLVGAGLIGSPVPKKSIPSPSDFGFAVMPDGGTFVCSMAGPVTGGFKGLTVMLVQGPVEKGSLSITGNTARFKGRATVVLVPGMNKEAVQIFNDVGFTVTVRAGGPGVGWLTVNVPAFAKALGGDTGGFLKLGRISVER